MIIDKTIKEKKKELLSYFRDRASESLTIVKNRFAETQSDKRARAINESLNQTRKFLLLRLCSRLKKNSGQTRKNLNVFF